MPIQVWIRDRLKGTFASVSDNNELMVAQQFSIADKVTLTIDNTAVNLIKPRAGQKAILTGLIVNTNRDIGVNGALIEIFETSTETSGTVDKAILSFDLVKNQTTVTAPILVETNEGKFINAKADDSEVNVTLFSYFAPA